MRKLILTVALLVTPVIGQAAPDIDSCGLGWQVTDAETLMGTWTRGTTNSIVPPSFGMTTGTIGCKQLPIAANEREAVNYVVNNYINLKQQLAVGSGEYVEGLNEVMNCNGAAVQQKYDSVVAPAKDGVELYQNLKNICG